MATYIEIQDLNVNSVRSGEIAVTFNIVNTDSYFEEANIIVELDGATQQDFPVNLDGNETVSKAYSYTGVSSGEHEVCAYAYDPNIITPTDVTDDQYDGPVVER
jgi:hypothetical protein